MKDYDEAKESIFDGYVDEFQVARKELTRNIGTLGRTASPVQVDKLMEYIESAIGQCADALQHLESLTESDTDETLTKEFQCTLETSQNSLDNLRRYYAEARTEAQKRATSDRSVGGDALDGGGQMGDTKSHRRKERSSKKKMSLLAAAVIAIFAAVVWVCCCCCSGTPSENSEEQGNAAKDVENPPAQPEQGNPPAAGDKAAAGEN